MTLCFHAAMSFGQEAPQTTRFIFSLGFGPSFRADQCDGCLSDVWAAKSKNIYSQSFCNCLIAEITLCDSILVRALLRFLNSLSLPR